MELGWIVAGQEAGRKRSLEGQTRPSRQVLADPWKILKSSKANIGTITVRFAASWPKGGPPPADEPKTAPEGSREATGRGNLVEGPFEAVERERGVLRAAISIRYKR